MPSTINASNSGFGGIVSTGDSSGELQLQAAGTTVAAITSTGMSVTGALTTNGVSTTPFTMKNRIINGDMQISQRGAVNVTSGGAYVYTAADRFSLSNYFGSGQINTAINTSIVPSGYNSSLGLTVSTAPPLNGSSGFYVALAQTIEGFNIADLYSQIVTLSFWVRSSVTGTYSVAFYNSDNTGISSTTRYYVANYTVNSANTWEQKTITVNLSTGTASGTWNSTNGVGLTLAWQLGGESNRKGNTFLDTWGTIGSTFQLASASQVNWASTSGATFYITGVQLERGSTATAFEWLPIGTELALCQRYLPAFGGTTGAIAAGFCAGSTSAFANVVFPVTTRTPATGITVSNATHFTVYNSGAAGITATALAFSTSSNSSATVSISTASGLVAGNGTLFLANNAAAQLLFTGCEL